MLVVWLWTLLHHFLACRQPGVQYESLGDVGSLVMDLIRSLYPGNEMLDLPQFLLTSQYFELLKVILTSQYFELLKVILTSQYFELLKVILLFRDEIVFSKNKLKTLPPTK
eukprot:sb/3477184/